MGDFSSPGGDSSGFGSIRSMLIEMFDERYATVIDDAIVGTTISVATVGLQRGWLM